MPGLTDTNGNTGTGTAPPELPQRNEQWRHLPAVPAERPGATERWLRTLVHDKRIPFSKVGGKVFINLDDLDALMDANVVRPEADGA